MKLYLNTNAQRGLFSTKGSPLKRYFVSLMALCIMISGCASIKTQFDTAQSEGSVAAYEKFLSKNPKGPYTTTARKALERLRFKDAIASENEEKLETLLANTKYPENDYVGEAKEVLAKLKATRLIENESMEGYHSFYSKFGDTIAAKELENSFDEFYGRFALSNNKLNNYVRYISRFPKGKFVTDARKRGEAIWWSEKSSTAGTKDYQKYLDLFPNGAHHSHVQEVLEKMMWSEAENTATDADLYLSYLERFPEGPHNSQARDCVDWSMAEKRCPEGIRSYLEMHPQGRFASRGQQILQSAEQVDDELKTRLWDGVWAQVKSALGQSTYGGQTMTVSGLISLGKTFLSYRGVVNEGGQARVLLNNHSTFEMSGTVYEYYEGDWFPVYGRIFKTKERKNQ